MIQIVQKYTITSTIDKTQSFAVLTTVDTTNCSTVTNTSMTTPFMRQRGFRNMKQYLLWCDQSAVPVKDVFFTIITGRKRNVLKWI